MDDLDSLRSLYRTNLEVIRDFLKLKTGVTTLREFEDFNREGVVLKSASKEPAQFRIFVSHEFLSDYSLDKTSELLKRWGIGEQLKALSHGTTLFITTEGTFIEKTEGQTPRDTAKIVEKLIPTSEQLRSLYNRVFSTLVDGRPLGDTPAEMRGDADLYSSYSTEYADVLGAVYLLDAAGYRDFQVNRNPREDPSALEVILPQTERTLLIFKRAIDAHQDRANWIREEINAQVRRSLQIDESLLQASANKFIQINLPHVPIDKPARLQIVNEILQFVRLTNKPEWLENRLVSFDFNLFPHLSDMGAKVYASRGATSISIQEGAHSFDPYSPYREIARIVAEQSKLHRAATHHPIWLGISLADSVIAPPELLDPIRIPVVEINNSPFDQIIVGSAEKATVYRKQQPPND